MPAIDEKLLAIALWGGTAIGFWLGPLNVFERVFAFAAACFLVAPGSWTDQTGFVLTAALMAWHFFRMRAKRTLQAA